MMWGCKWLFVCLEIIFRALQTYLTGAYIGTLGPFYLNVQFKRIPKVEIKNARNCLNKYLLPPPPKKKVTRQFWVCASQGTFIVGLEACSVLYRLKYRSSLNAVSSQEPFFHVMTQIIPSFLALAVILNSVSVIQIR